MGVLLVNLGTPDQASPAAVKRYLAEFLSDKRVVEIPALIWQPILRGIILNTRPRKSAHAYSQVWTEEGSPLAAITARQARALQGAWGEDVIVDHAKEELLAGSLQRSASRVRVIATLTDAASGPCLSR